VHPDPTSQSLNLLHALADGWQRVKKRFAIGIGLIVAAGLFEIRHADNTPKVAAITVIVITAMLIMVWGQKLGLDKD
jgi:hypothetical protein